MGRPDWHTVMYSPRLHRLLVYCPVHTAQSDGNEQADRRASTVDITSEARCLPLSESEVKRGSYVIPKYSLCNGSKDES